MTHEKIATKLDKPALSSKKFVAFAGSEILLGGLLLLGLIRGADLWVLRILAGGLVACVLGYVLGTATLESITHAVLGRLPLPTPPGAPLAPKADGVASGGGSA